MWINNLTKTNPQGTLVNDTPVDGRCALEAGDIISINGRKFRFDAPEEAVAVLERSARKAKYPKAAPEAAGATKDENAGQKPVAGSINAMASPSVRSALIARRAAFSGDAPDSSPDASPRPAAKLPESRKKSPKPARLPGAAPSGAVPSDVTKSSAIKPRATETKAAAPLGADRGSLMAQLQERLASSRVASPAAAKPPAPLCADPPTEEFAEPAPANKEQTAVRKACTPQSVTPKAASAQRATPKPAATPSPAAQITATVDSVVENIFASVSGTAKATPQRDEKTHATLCAMIQKRWTPTSIRKVNSKTPAAARTPLLVATVAARPTQVQPAHGPEQSTPLAPPGEPGSVCRGMLPPRTVGKPLSMEEFGSARKPATPKPVAKAPQPDGADLVDVDGTASSAIKKPRSSLRGSVSGGRKKLRVSFGSAQLELGPADISPRLLPTPGKVKLSPAAHIPSSATGAELESADVPARMLVVIADASPLVRNAGARRVSIASGAEPRRRSVKFQRTSEDSLRLSSADELGQADGPTSERKRKPLRQSWEQTPGRKVERRSSKTPAAQKCQPQPTPATNAPATANSTVAKSNGGSMGSAVRSKFTPNAASVVSGLLEGEFTPLYAVDGPDGAAELGVSPGTMHAFGLFRMGAPGFTPSSRGSFKPSPGSGCNSAASMTPSGPAWSDVASTPGGETPSYAKPMPVPPFEPTPPPAAVTTLGHKSPMPAGGRVNSHVRFINGQPVATGETWAGVMRYEVTVGDLGGELVAEPVEMSFWGAWEEVQQWNDEEWAEAEAEEWQSGEDEPDEGDGVPSISPGAHLRPAGAHIRFDDAVDAASPAIPHAAPFRAPKAAVPLSRSIARQSLEVPDAAATPAPARRESLAESEAIIYGWEQVFVDEAVEDVTAEAGDAALDDFEAAHVFGVSGVLSSTRGATPPAHIAHGRTAAAAAVGLIDTDCAVAHGSSTAVLSMPVHSDLEVDGTPIAPGEEAAPTCRLSFVADATPVIVAAPSPAPSSRRSGSRRSSLSSNIATPAPVTEPPPAPAPTPASLGLSRRASPRRSSASSSAGRRSDRKVGSSALQAHHVAGMFSPASEPAPTAQGDVLAKRFSPKRSSKPLAAPSVQSAYSVVMPSPGSARLGHSVAQWPPKSRRASVASAPASDASESSFYDETSEDEDDWTDCTTDAEEPAVEAGPSGMAHGVGDQSEAAVDFPSPHPAPSVFNGQVPEPGSVSRDMPPAAVMPSVAEFDEFGSARKPAPSPAAADLPVESSVASHAPVLESAEEDSTAREAARGTPETGRLTTEGDPVAGGEPATEPDCEAVSVVVGLARADLESLKVVELRAMLEARGLSPAGRKVELVQRLIDAAPGAEDATAHSTDGVPSTGDAVLTQLNTMKVAELRALLSDAGLEVAGKKHELLARAVEAVACGKLVMESRVPQDEEDSGRVDAPSSDEEGEPPPSAGGEDRLGKRVRFGAQNIECAITPAPSVRKTKRAKAEPAEVPSSADSMGSARRRSMRGRQ